MGTERPEEGTVMRQIGEPYSGNDTINYPVQHALTITNDRATTGSRARTALQNKTGEIVKWKKFMK